MSSFNNNVLGDRDANASIAGPVTAGAGAQGKPDVKSMEYHRQVLQSKMEQEKCVLSLFSVLSLFLVPLDNDGTNRARTHV